MSRFIYDIGRWFGLEFYRGEVEICRSEIECGDEDMPAISGPTVLCVMRIGDFCTIKRVWLARLKALLDPHCTPLAIIEHFDEAGSYDMPAAKMPPTPFRHIRPRRSYAHLPPTKLRGGLPRAAEALLAAHEPLRMIAENLRRRHPREGAKSPRFGEMEAYLFYTYIQHVLKRYRPAAIVMWNAFTPFNMVLRFAAKLADIPCMFMEYGSLPGTFSIETLGQMGESFPSRHTEEFNRLPLHPDEICAAEDYVARLRKSGLNRRPQTSASCQSVIEGIRRNNDGPVIFHAGQNDFESGMIPASDNSRRYHSPMFESTIDSVLHLDRLAEKNGWNLVFKPHPIIAQMTADFPDVPLKRTTVLTDANVNEVIDLTDATATILSQVGYIALIRNKPLISLGYTQLRGSGAAYEAFEPDRIEDAVSSSVKYGMTQRQRTAFLCHVARMLKYYLYDDLTENVRVCRKTEYDWLLLLNNLMEGRRVVY